MKTKHVFIVALVLLLGNFSIDVVAQSNLDALVKKCETMDSVNMNILKNKDPQTKKIIRVIKTITIRDNPSLTNEFIEAFKKDEEQAFRVVDEKIGQKVYPSYYQFDNVSYSFSITKDGKITSISAIEEPK